MFTCLGGHLFKDLVLCWQQVCISFCSKSVFISTLRQVNKVESICVQGLTCVLFIDKIEHLYSSNTAKFVHISPIGMSHRMSYNRIETENGMFVITKPDAVNRF